MDFNYSKFISKAPDLDMSEGREMLTEFTAEAHKHLLSARNQMLVLETVSEDRESLESLFKSFHTIKGLADFLNLEDICCLAGVTETLLDLARKKIVEFTGKAVSVTKDSIDHLYELLELLSEQISNDGQLKSPYIDISPTVYAVNEILSEVSQKNKGVEEEPASRPIPTIRFDKKESDYADLKKKLASSDKDTVIDKQVIENLIEELEGIKGGMKEAQSKSSENQRQLVKEREMSIKLTQQAHSMARAKSEYLASMAHEFRTLINAILGFTNILKNGPLNSKQKEQVETILLSGNLLLGIVNDILDFSKLEAGKLELEIIDFNLETLVEDVFRILRTKLQDKPINFYYKIADNVPVDLKGDPTRVKQIVINLLDNAIKFTDKGEIGLTVTLDDVSNTADKKFTLLFVNEDTGIGIPDDRKDAIFESFTQANSSITRKYGGSGLGLTLCKNYVENMEGKIWVESLVGKGSKFIFTAKFQQGGKVKKEKIDPGLINAVKGHGIFAVLNSEKTKYLLEKLCSSLDIGLTTIIKDVNEAFDKLNSINEQSLPDLLFIDTLLPNNDGITLAARVRQESRFEKIHLVAVCSALGCEQKYRQFGFEDIVARPIVRDEFLNMLGRIIVGEGRGAQKRTAENIQSVSCEGIKVLVVEDSVPNQELLKAHFETLGCEADYANNGQEAVDKLKENEYDLCFMDLQMPIMGGIEAARKIRSVLNNETPIVALTAAEVEEEKKECLKVGMNDYLAKPFSLDELREKIVINTNM